MRIIGAVEKLVKHPLIYFGKGIMFKLVKNTDKNHRVVIMINMAILIFAVLGAIGWFGSLIAVWELPFWGAYSNELPLGDLKGITVDSKGRLYCGLQSYSRIQVYDATGNFLHGWFVRANGGAFRIRINSVDQLEVATARNDMLFTFDHNGLIVDQSSNVSHYFDKFGEKGERIYFDKTGILYSIRGGFFSPRVVRQDQSGNESTIVTTAWYKWLVMKPFPAWLFLAIAGILQIIKKRLVTFEKR